MIYAKIFAMFSIFVVSGGVFFALRFRKIIAAYSFVGIIAIILNISDIYSFTKTYGKNVLLQYSEKDGISKNQSETDLQRQGGSPINVFDFTVGNIEIRQVEEKNDREFLSFSVDVSVVRRGAINRCFISPDFQYDDFNLETFDSSYVVDQVKFSKGLLSEKFEKKGIEGLWWSTPQSTDFIFREATEEIFLFGIYL